MPGSFESVQWNTCVHRLDLNLYSHLKVFWGMESELYVNSKEKSPLLEAQRRAELTTLHHSEQQAQHTAD